MEIIDKSVLDKDVCSTIHLNDEHDEDEEGDSYDYRSEGADAEEDDNNDDNDVIEQNKVEAVLNKRVSRRQRCSLRLSPEYKDDASDDSEDALTDEQIFLMEAAGVFNSHAAASSSSDSVSPLSSSCSSSAAASSASSSSLLDEDPCVNVSEEYTSLSRRIVKFILDVVTRWNSTLKMMGRAYRLKDVIQELMTKSSNSIVVLSSIETHKNKQMLLLL